MLPFDQDNVRATAQAPVALMPSSQRLQRSEHGDVVSTSESGSESNHEYEENVMAAFLISPSQKLQERYPKQSIKSPSVGRSMAYRK
jgi:hypothetical protein